MASIYHSFLLPLDHHSVFPCGPKWHVVTPSLAHESIMNFFLPQHTRPLTVWCAPKLERAAWSPGLKQQVPPCSGSKNPKFRPKFKSLWRCICQGREIKPTLINSLFTWFITYTPSRWASICTPASATTKFRREPGQRVGKVIVFRWVACSSIVLYWIVLYFFMK